MGQITELKMRGKKLVEVFIDNESIGKICVDAVVTFGFKSGVEVDLDKIRKIQYESNLILAKDKALNLLSRFPHTEFEIKSKLKRSGFGEDVCKACIDFLREYKYINDEEYAKIYIQTKGSKIGKNKLSMDLLKKGVSKEVSAKLLDEFECDREEVFNILKKFMSNKERNLKNKSKAYRFLYSRGFPSEDCMACINRYFGEEYDWS